MELRLCLFSGAYNLVRLCYDENVVPARASAIRSLAFPSAAAVGTVMFLSCRSAAICEKNKVATIKGPGPVLQAEPD